MASEPDGLRTTPSSILLHGTWLIVYCTQLDSVKHMHVPIDSFCFILDEISWLIRPNSTHTFTISWMTLDQFCTWRIRYSPSMSLSILAMRKPPFSRQIMFRPLDWFCTWPDSNTHFLWHIAISERIAPTALTKTNCASFTESKLFFVLSFHLTKLQPNSMCRPNLALARSTLPSR